jgi:hypothetical protein
MTPRQSRIAKLIMDRAPELHDMAEQQRREGKMRVGMATTVSFAIYPDGWYRITMRLEPDGWYWAHPLPSRKQFTQPKFRKLYVASGQLFNNQTP